MEITTETLATTALHDFELYRGIGDDSLPLTVTGCLPHEGVWAEVSHYDLQDALVRDGVIERRRCDSESGQFFVYPADEEQGRRVLAWLDERFARAAEPRNLLA